MQTEPFVEEIFNKKNPAAIDEICSPDYIDHDPLPGMPPNLDGLKQFYAMGIGARLRRGRSARRMALFQVKAGPVSRRGALDWLLVRLLNCA